MGQFTKIWASTVIAGLLLTCPGLGQEPLKMEVKDGQTVFFPHGTASFADQVVTFQPGTPPAEADFSVPFSALGPPDYDKKKDGTKFVSLGKGGILVVEFVDNRLVDVEGDDLYIFEIGPTVEGTTVAISVDGETWFEVGKVQGSTSSVDIKPFSKPGQQFRFVRLTDDPTEGNHRGRTAGADIDAIGAIGSVPVKDK
jgi:hypothetical protein